MLGNLYIDVFDICLLYDKIRADAHLFREKYMRGNREIRFHQGAIVSAVFPVRKNWLLWETRKRGAEKKIAPNRIDTCRPSPSLLLGCFRWGRDVRTASRATVFPHSSKFPDLPPGNGTSPRSDDAILRFLQAVCFCHLARTRGRARFFASLVS